MKKWIYVELLIHLFTIVIIFYYSYKLAYTERCYFSLLLALLRPQKRRIEINIKLKKLVK